MQSATTEPGRQPRALPLFILYCVCGILINLAGITVARSLQLPLYLDAIGTILVSITGGYLPGIAVGFLTNMLTGFLDPANPYYAVLNVLIALFAALFARKGWFRNFWKGLLAVVIFALLGGGGGTVMTWLIGGMQLELTDLALAIQAKGFGAFWAQFIANTAWDVVDKAIAVVPGAIAIHFLPQQLALLSESLGWRNTLLAEKTRCYRRRSLHVKLLFLIAVSMLLTAVASTLISGLLYHRTTVSQHANLATGVANFVARAVDPERVDDYLELGEAAEGYLETEKLLYEVRDSSPDIEYVYVYRILPDGCHVVFDLDTEELPGGEPGEIVEFDESFSVYLPALLAGEEIEPLITNDTFGWLLTVYLPVRDAAGVCQCYAAVDIAMGDLIADDVSFVSRVTALFLGFFVLVLVYGLWLVEHYITRPLNTMARVTGAFAYDSEEARSRSVESIRALDIRSGDEIENLYLSFNNTAETTVRYIEDVEKKGREIAKLQQGLILVLADMVESRDQCTGDHVRKTAAYTKVIMDELRREGRHTDVLTDAFVEDVVNSAPLHDVGKIHVPDALLNKPGKLTDEEFKKMQEHTLAGSEIILRAMALVSEESGYLNEARNLAEYHHEKWDGSGYPKHLKGEDIPLSARIMAVADVFDALISRRSYKAPFTIEQALDIIREGMGTHFDPEIAQAFLNAEPEVRRIAEMNMDI